LGRNFHAGLATPLAQSLQWWPPSCSDWAGHCKPGGSVAVVWTSYGNPG